jgi:hypothetical protein
MSSAAKYSDRFKKEVKEKETSKEPVVSTKSFADFPALGKAKTVEKSSSATSSPWAQTLKDSIAAAAAAAAAAEIKRKAEDETNRVISSAAPQWAPALRVKGYVQEEGEYDESEYTEQVEESGYNGALYEEESRTPPYR